MTFVLLAHVVVAAVCLVGSRRLGRWVLLVGALGPLSSLWPVVLWAVGGRGVLVTERAWVSAVGLDLVFRLDGFSVLMVGLVGGVGVVVFVYAWSYFGERAGLGRFAAYLVVFAGAMFGLVTADNLLLLFVFWELTSVMSYLLIGFEHEKAVARASALQALLVTGVGGLAMLAGVVLLAQAGGSYSLAVLLADPPVGGSVGAALALILVGAFAKSAQVPFHFWLPGAMAAPTPVSAYLHSATMVKAGVYLVARLAPVYAVLVSWWRPLVVGVGVVTMLVGGWRALAQTDLKLVLAQGTVSQLGFMMVLVGSGEASLVFAGMAMVLAHSLFKAALFMVAGIIDHQAHTRDLRRLDGLGASMPATAWVSALAVASMAGVPPLLGYLAKEAALEGLVTSASWWTTGAVAVGSVLTVAYGLRFLWGAFARKPNVDDHVTGVAAPTGWFLAPAALLVGLSVVGGVVSRVSDAVVGAAAGAVSPGADGHHLALWHGWGLPLALSAVAIGGGWVVWRWPLHRVRAVTTRFPDASAVYTTALGLVNRVAERVTSTVQNGSLPVYLGVILVVAIIAPGVPMVRSLRDLPVLVWAESPVQVVAAAVVIGGCVGIVAARRRLRAVLMLGAIGYGVAVLFVMQGAPDLALTQLLVETLALALFVLVLSRFPPRFEVLGTRLRHVTRIVIATGAGLAATAMAVWAVAGRVAPSYASEFIEGAEPEGGGRNVVNVILTDFRALDTLGEITVLAVVAMGVVMLVRARLPEDIEEARVDPGEEGGS